MERRLGRLETLWQGDPRATSEASWSIQYALQYPELDRDKAAWATRIRTAHELDDDGLQRAAVLALTRLGMGHDDTRRLAALGIGALLHATNDDPASSVLAGV